MKALIKSDEGQTLVWVALTLVVLLGAAALAIDFGNAYFAKRRMQNAADAGALAGAGELCLGKDPDDANSMAEEYAVARNGADWATPVPSGDSMTVTAIEQVDYVLARVLVDPDFVMVAAQAKAECQSPSTGIPTMPLTISQYQWDLLSCGDTVYITTKHYTTPTSCPSGCDCDHVFTGAPTDTSSERGWFENVNLCAGESPGCKIKDAMPWGGCKMPTVEIGDCLDDQTGSVESAFGGANGKTFKDWVASSPTGIRTVRFPMYSKFGPPCGKVGCSAGYTVSGFACVDIHAGKTDDVDDGWWKKDDWPVDPPEASCSLKDLKGSMVGTINCNCTIENGFGGGPEDPNAVKIPVLTE